jgi:ankyrin repeat protein
MLAAMLGNSEDVQVLLTAGANVNATNSNGLTAVHLADNAKIAAELIGTGADVNARTSTGLTPVDAAREFGRLDVLSLLTNTIK